MSKPPTGGPSVALIWKLPLFQVIAPGKSLRGTICGRKALLAGQRNERATALTTKNRYIQETGT